MRYPWSTRLLRAFVALWFLAFGGELGGVHACPMHDGFAPASAHGSVAQHGGHDHHASGGASTPAPAHGGSGGGHACTCVGMGCGSPPVASIATAPEALTSTVTPRAAAGVVYVEVVRAGRTVHVLPFANGPPARAVTA